MAAWMLIAVGTFAGAAVQRLTGLGFGLVAGPLLVLGIGPVTGVTLANALSLIINLALVVLLARDVDWSRAALLAVPALLAIPVGAAVVRAMPAPQLSVLVGITVLLALGAVVASRRARVLHGHRGALVAGAASGFMNATAAVGGPAVTVYAVSSGWSGPPFAATLQVYFATINAAALLAKGLPDVDAASALAAAVALAAGAGVGQVLARRVSFEQAFPAVVALAFLASVITVVRGLLAW